LQLKEGSASSNRDGALTTLRWLCFRFGARSRSCCGLRLDHFFFQYGPDIPEQGLIDRGGDQFRGARPPKRIINDLFDPTRPGRHNHDPVAQKNGLFNAAMASENFAISTIFTSSSRNPTDRKAASKVCVRIMALKATRRSFRSLMVLISPLWHPRPGCPARGLQPPTEKGLE